MADQPDGLQVWKGSQLDKSKYLSNWPEQGVKSYVCGILERRDSRIRVLSPLDGGTLMGYIVMKNDYALIDHCFLLHEDHVYAHPTEENALVWIAQGGYDAIDAENIITCEPFEEGVRITERNHVGYFANKAWVWRKERPGLTVATVYA